MGNVPPDTSPTPAGPLDSGYHPPTDSTSVLGPVDIFNLPSGLKDQPVLVAGQYREPPKGLPGNVPRGPFLEANDFPDSGLTGTAYSTVSEILADEIRKSAVEPGRLLDLQQKLYDGGFFGSTPATRISWGVWSTETKDAIVASLVDTLQQTQQGVPITWSDFLDKRQAAGKANNKPQIQQLDYADPAAIEMSAQKAAEDAIGRRLNDVEVQKFVEKFRGMQGNYYAQKLYGTPGQGEGSTMQLTPPDLSGQSEQFVEQNFSHEIGAERGRTYVSALMDLLGVKGA